MPTKYLQYPQNPIFLRELAADPSTPADTGAFYSKDVAGVTTPFWRYDNNGVIINLTAGGGGGGINMINGDNTANQLLVVGSSGIDFTIVDGGAGVHTFNIPTSSAVNRGLLSSADWSTFNGKGNMNGPFAFTFNAVARYLDGTNLENSGVIIDNSNNITGGVNFDISGYFTQAGEAAPAISPAGSGRIYFDSGSNKYRVSQNNGAYVDLLVAGGEAPADATYVTLSANASLTNERVLTGTANQVILTDNGANSTVVISLPQDIATASSPSFTGLGLSGNTAKSFVYSDASKGIVTTSAPTNGQLLIGSTGNIPALGAITGTSNQVTVTLGSGTIVLSGPQDLAAASTPTFGGLTLNGNEYVTGLVGFGVSPTTSQLEVKGVSSKFTITNASPNVTGGGSTVINLENTDQTNGNSAALKWQSGGVVTSSITQYFDDHGAGTETSSFIFSTRNAGTFDNRIKFASNGAIRSIGAVTNNITFQDQTLTPGATYNSVAISPTFASENFTHRTLALIPIQTSTNTQALAGLYVLMTKATALTTLATMTAIEIASPSITGTVTASTGIKINDQTNANSTLAYAINITTSGVQNSILWGGSALQYASAANNIRIADSTNVGGLDFNLTTTSPTINTIATTNTGIIFQSGIYTGSTSAFSVTSQFVTENLNHTASTITAQQNGASAGILSAINAGVIKATGATNLTEGSAIIALSPVITGTMTRSSGLVVQDQSILNISTTAYGIRILSQSANATTSRAIQLEGSNVNNAIRFGNSANMYSNGANNIRHSDSTNLGAIDFNLTTAGNQTISCTLGSLIINAPTAASLLFQINSATVSSANATEFVMTNGQKGKVTTSAAGNYTILLTDFIIAKTGITGGGDTVTLPSATTAGAGKMYRLKDQAGTAAANNITVAATAGNIDGAATKLINANYGSLDFYSDGSNWFIV